MDRVALENLVEPDLGFVPDLDAIPGDVYFIDRLPVAFDPLDLAVILGASVVISFVATLYPARQAARLYPLDAIRHE